MDTLESHINPSLEASNVSSALESIAFGQSIVDQEDALRAADDSAPPEGKNSKGYSGVSHFDESAGQLADRLFDLDFVQRNHPLPTPEEYPGAPPELFSPVLLATAIDNACAKRGLSIQTDVDFSVKAEPKSASTARSQGLWQCTMRVDITGFGEEVAMGEGRRKQYAKQAAWVHLTSKLHARGVLKSLFPSHPTTKPAQRLEADETPRLSEETPEGEPEEITESEPEENVESEPTTSLSADSDAKMDIYRYAARCGLVPRFESKVSGAEDGAGLAHDDHLYEASIQLEEQAINVTATGKDLATAEMAAVKAFKEAAERRYKAANEDLPSSPSVQTASFHVLDEHTARRFLAFYKRRGNGLNLVIEHGEVQQEGTHVQNKAALTIDGTTIHPPVIMPTKKQAVFVAYLIAAVEIGKSHPDVLCEFVESLQSREVKMLREPPLIDIEISRETMRSMKGAVVEARQGGLSDARQTLTGEPSRWNTVPARRRSPFPPSHAAAADARLLLRHTSSIRNPLLRRLRSDRTSLSMNSSREDILRLINGNQYSVVAGATGSGKTTQVPQILFDEAILANRSSSCNIICTQPRRIAATSVAQRVAAERQEVLGETIGYQVRFDAQLPSEPYGITYCTNGILLQRLKRDADETLDGVSHIILDEVHERSLEVDLLMTVLKRQITTRRAEGRRTPKIVLMSATLDSELIANYFRNPDEAGVEHPCPALSVPGRTFSIKEKFLGSIMSDLLQKRGAEFRGLIDKDAATGKYLAAESDFSAKMSRVDRTDSESVIDWKRERHAILGPEDGEAARREREDALVPIALVAATIADICCSSRDGAILAFLPGLAEILDVQKLLVERKLFGIDFSDSSRFQLCLLHSSLPKEQQALVFQPSRPGSRKVILATNIAETSVTVPDVKYVVDTGKHREHSHDHEQRTTKLHCAWESQANAKQRAGRAGRVRDGVYYALYSKERADSLHDVGMPEILRTDLQATCLSIRSQTSGESIVSLLSEAIEPPARDSVEAAVEKLISIQALTSDEQLTVLGRVLAELPVHPVLGKMIIMGIIFKCIDPIIILAAAATEQYRLFAVSFEKREEATRAYQNYADSSASDHIAFLQAFNDIRALRNTSEPSARRRAQDLSVNYVTFTLVDQIARQMEQVLRESGLVTIDGNAQNSEYGPADLNRNAANHDLIKSLLVAAHQPNVAAKTKMGGLSYRTPTTDSALVNPRSVNGELRRESEKRHAVGSLFTYSNLSRGVNGRTLYIKNSTKVTPLMVALFGGQLQITGVKSLIMDNWLPFSIRAPEPELSTKLVVEFRKALDRVLHHAFNSLSAHKVNEGVWLQNDSITDKFVERVVEILRQTSEDSFQAKL